MPLIDNGKALRLHRRDQSSILSAASQILLQASKQKIEIGHEPPLVLA
jgi:hypothetical protein